MGHLKEIKYNTLGHSLPPLEVNSLVLITALRFIFIESPGCGVQKVRWNLSISLLAERLVCNYHINNSR